MLADKNYSNCFVVASVSGTVRLAPESLSVIQQTVDEIGAREQSSQRYSD
jgi:hypothetical protein